VVKSSLDIIKQKENKKWQKENRFINAISGRVKRVLSEIRILIIYGVIQRASRG